MLVFVWSSPYLSFHMAIYAPVPFEVDRLIWQRSWATNFYFRQLLVLRCQFAIRALFLAVCRLSVRTILKITSLMLLCGKTSGWLANHSAPLCLIKHYVVLLLRRIFLLAPSVRYFCKTGMSRKGNHRDYSARPLRWESFISGVCNVFEQP